MEKSFTSVIGTTLEEMPAFADDFTFDLEELDSNRAMMLVVVLDPMECPITHFC